MLADLPPSSKVAGINLSAAACATPRPTSVEPVKASLAKPGCSKTYWPDLLPLPVITLSTPAGSTPSIKRTSSKTLRLVVLEGLSTIQSPAASAGASFHAAMRNGKFHGIICPTTPIGSCRTRLKVLLSSMVAVPSSVRMAAAK